MIKTNLIKGLRPNVKFFQIQQYKMSFENKILSDEKEYIHKFLSSHSSFSGRELGEVSRIIAKHKINDNQTWEAFESCAIRNASSLDEIDLRKVMSALISNERGSSELCSSLAERQKEIHIKVSGISADKYNEVKASFENSKRSNAIPLPMKIYLMAYNLRWRFFRYLQRFGLFFK